MCIRDSNRILHFGELHIGQLGTAAGAWVNIRGITHRAQDLFMRPINRGETMADVMGELERYKSDPMTWVLANQDRSWIKS